MELLGAHAQRIAFALVRPGDVCYDRARRVREVARFLLAAGDGARSRELLEELVAQLPAASEERARALILLRLHNERPLPLDSTSPEQ